MIYTLYANIFSEIIIQVQVHYVLYVFIRISMPVGISYIHNRLRRPHT